MFGPTVTNDCVKGLEGRTPSAGNGAMGNEVDDMTRLRPAWLACELRHMATAEEVASALRNRLSLSSLG